MGAYSQIDAELRYGGAAFVEDEADEAGDCPAFVPDEDETEAIPGPTVDNSPKDQPEPALLTPPEPVQVAEPVQTEPQSTACRCR